MVTTPNIADEGGTKRRAVLSAAADLFLGQGYSATSMDQIAQRAVVSKATVYAYFPSKEALFAEMCAIKAAQREALIAEVVAAGSDIRTALRAIGRQFADVVLSPEGIAMYRLLVAETPRVPGLGRAFFAAGPQTNVKAMSALLAVATSRGELDVADPEAAAWQFSSLLRGRAFMRRIFGAETAPPSDDERAEAVNEAVEFFVRAYAPKG